jgi:hypothetical protein
MHGIHRATIRFPSHTVHIRIHDLRQIHVFKYNNRTCDFDIFSDQHEASEYILTDLPHIGYRVIVPGEIE